ncbi:MAG: hypothetical protein NVS4B8_20430 [Herpetosiphon sp.]
MIKGVVRVLAFFSKELAEVRRQPRLIASLVMGPFLILLLFGLGYKGEQPKLKAILVVPPAIQQDPRVQALEKNVGPNFQVVDIVSDQAGAEGRLKRGDVNVVEVIPADVDQLFGRDHQSSITVLYNEINPLQEQWIRYLTYAQVKELNTALLLNLANVGKQESNGVAQYVGDARTELGTIEAGLKVANNEQTRAAIQRLRSNNGLLLAGLVLAGQSQANDEAQQGVQDIQNNLTQLDASLQNGQIAEQQQRLQMINERLGEIERIQGQVKATPAEVLVSPLKPDPHNVADLNYKPDYITFYTPGVVALLLQHMAITLAALSLVRENLLGSVEVFRVAPIGSGQIMTGKYAGYTLLVGIVALLLTGALTANIALGNVASQQISFGMGVPFIGSVYLFAFATLLLIWASLGIGFVISAISKTESQAVQFSMILLLASVFFSGFFLPLENFIPGVRGFAYMLPVTHGIQAYQDIMLRGRVPSGFVMSALSTIALVCFVLAWQLWRSQIKRR